METVVQPPPDAELHLLTDWGDAGGSARRKRAAVVSLLVHAAVVLLLILVPIPYTEPVRQAAFRLVTPLIEPPTVLTQPTPNKEKVPQDFNATELRARPRIQVPQGLPSTTRPQALRPSPVPSLPKPGPVAAELPEPPKISAPPKETVKPDLLQATVVPPPPQIQAEEKPKSPFENPSAPTAPAKTGRVPIPNPSVAEAIRQAGSGSPGGGQTVGDTGTTGIGGVGSGANLPPAPGSPGSNLQLLSDPMGVDFRPYLTQVLTKVRRNWFSVMPESVRLGQRGRVGVLFAIARDGTIAKVTFAAQSGVRVLDQTSVAAISMSNPLPPLPSEFKGDRVVLQLNFSYNMPK